ncbi:MAG: hypothetical protein IAI50_03770 [Candidatus Eremiobacteraeota bacterium]|nr:hypothetical protein [Candidatus Eremiobacteraeota bacterium]
MKRRLFLDATLAATAVSAVPLDAFAGFIAARTTTQKALFDALPRAKPGQWVRLIMGSGVVYQKQIGAATESTSHGELLYFETQVGTPGGSCNPNTMKRTYLSGSRFPSLLDQSPVQANVANSGTTLTRWSDAGSGQTIVQADSHLRILDAKYLYDDRPLRIVSSKAETVDLPGGSAYSGSAESGRGKLQPMPTTHIVAEFSPPYDERHELTRIELWTTPNVPLGVVKYRAIAKDHEPFELRLFSYGTRFKSDLAMSLQTIRSITPDGTYIETS